MLRSLPQCIKYVSVLQRLLFPAAVLPDTFPNRWELATEFGNPTKGSCIPLVAHTKVFVENLQELDAAAFSIKTSY